MEEMILEAGKNRLYKLLIDTKGMSSEQLESIVEEAYFDLAALTLNEKNLLDEIEVSKLYPFTLAYLRSKRFQGEGPVYHKFGDSRNGKVFYRVGDLENWIKAHRQDDPIQARIRARR